MKKARGFFILLVLPRIRHCKVESGAMFIAAIRFVVGAFFCSCTSRYTHRKNALSASHLIRSESLLPNPIGGFGVDGKQTRDATSVGVRKIFRVLFRGERVIPDRGY